MISIHMTACIMKEKYSSLPRPVIQDVFDFEGTFLKNLAMM